MRRKWFSWPSKRRLHVSGEKRLSTRSPRSRRRRAVGWSALAAFLLLLIAMILAVPHIVVSGHLLRSWVNHHPEDFLLEYDAGSSFVPGVVRIRGLRVRGRDANVEWFFQMDDTRISVSLLDLLAKRFHATEVRATGLTFRLRLREEKREVSRAHAAALPRIPGFPDPPLKDDRRLPEPQREPEEKLWSIQLDRILADPTPEIWIDLYRFRGRARVTGGFSLQPRVRAAVGPSAVEFLAGAISLGQEGILDAATGRADCTIEPYDPSRVRGDAVWPRISGRFRIAGAVPGLEFLDYFLRLSPEPRLDGGRGKGMADVRVDHGIGTGRVELSARDLSARYSDAVVRGRVSVRANVRRWDFEHDRIDISGTRIDVRDVVSTGKHQDSRDWWGVFDLGAAEVRNGLTTRVSIDCRDARPLFRLFDVQLPGWAQAVLKLEGLKAGARVRLAPSVVHVQNLEAAGGKFHIAGDYRKQGTERRGAFLVETGPLSVGIDIEGPKSRVKLLGARKWFQEEAGRRSKPDRTAGPSGDFSSTGSSYRALVWKILGAARAASAQR